ncbi:MAG: nuclear transport factor 2 family protein [Ilumatobacter sp.]|uniref:YybH family protein n=1 Tax=Ilumatobacter sp. TaxID=1967498 RepID=UPI00329985B9
MSSKSEETAAVEAANDSFYHAFEERDLDAMALVWERSERSFCTHPGWPTLIGWRNIVRAWHALFSNQERLNFIVPQPTVHIEGGVAWVFCEENLIDVGPTGRIQTVNVFAKDSDGSWSMFGHVGSPAGPATRSL